MTPFAVYKGTFSSRIGLELSDVGMSYEGVTKMILPTSWSYGTEDPAYIRFTLERPSKDAVPIITINEPIE